MATVDQKPHNSLVDRKSPEYLAQLLNDKKQLQALPNVFVHVEKILDEEINRVRGTLFHWSANKEQLRLPEPSGPIVTLTDKLFVPLHEHPDFNFVGRILGPRGMTAKQLEMDTGCKIMVRGKGSMRDKIKEEQNRGKPNWEHLNEDLHVLISVDDTENRAQLKLARAVDEVQKLLVPTSDGEDELKKMQLLELAIMNGTYREALQPPPTAAPGTAFIINTPQGPRIVAATGQSALGLPPTVLQQPGPMMQPSPVAAAAGSPIILAPHVQTPQLVPSQPAVLGAASPTPSVNAPSVPTSGLVYSYDTAYLQRMLDYSTAFEPAAVGPMPKLRRTVAVREHPYNRGVGPLI